MLIETWPACTVETPAAARVAIPKIAIVFFIILAFTNCIVALDTSASGFIQRPLMLSISKQLA
jgi:hypothetical protein